MDRPELHLINKTKQHWENISTADTQQDKLFDTLYAMYNDHYQRGSQQPTLGTISTLKTFKAQFDGA